MSREVNLGRYKTEQQAKAAICGAEIIAHSLGHVISKTQVYEHDFDNFDTVTTMFVADVWLDKVTRLKQ